MARYRIVALPTMSKGGIFNRKKNQAPPQVTHTAIDPAYLEKNPDVASSIQNMPEVGTSYTRKRDKWGRPEGDKWYQYDPKKKGFIDDQGRSYEPQWRTDEAIKNKEKNKSWGQRIGDFVNQDILGYPSDHESAQQMAKVKPKVFVDPFGKKHTGHGYWDNYGDAGVQMVHPEAYAMGPGAGGAGMAKQGINALMEGVAGINKFAVNDLLSAGVRSALSPLEKTLAEKATVGNFLGAYGAADAVVNKAPKLVGDVSSMITQGYSNDKALDALKQTVDIGTSFMGYTPLANAKYLNKAEDVYSLSKATASNLEDPTSLDNQYSFYRSLGKLSGIKKKGGSSKPCPKGKIYDPITKQCVSEEAYQILDYIGTNKQNLNTKQAVIENQNYLDADKFLTDYYNSPRYKQMVYGSAITPEAAAWIIKSRNKQLETTPPLQVLQQPKDSPSTAGQSWSDTGQIEVFPAGFGTAATSVHELSHSSDRPIKGWNRLIPQKDINYINEHKAKVLGDSREYFDYLDYYKSLSKEELAEEQKNFKEYYTEYVGDPTETRARLNEIRYLSKQNNLYDPFTQKVTPEIFKNKLKNFKYETDDKSGFDPMMQLKNTFSDEEIIYMLNNISQNENPETNDELQYSKKGGSIQLELSDEEIQDYIKRGYVIEEAVPKMSSGGKVVSELWTEITGTPWQEAKTRGLTTGTFDENIALRNRLLAGEFGKINNAVSPKTNYDLTVEELVKKGKTLDDLVSMKVGTRSGLMSRFPELFDEETKNKVEAQLDEEENKNYDLQSKLKTEDQWGRAKTNDWYGFNPDTKKWTVKDQWGRSPDDEWYNFNPDTKKFKHKGTNQTQKKAGITETKDVLNKLGLTPWNKVQFNEPVIENSNQKFEKDLLNRLTTIAKQKALLKPETINKVEPNKEFYDNNGKEIKPIMPKMSDFKTDNPIMEALEGVNQYIKKTVEKPFRFINDYKNEVAQINPKVKKYQNTVNTIDTDIQKIYYDLTNPNLKSSEKTAARQKYKELISKRTKYINAINSVKRSDAGWFDAAINDAPTIGKPFQKFGLSDQPSYMTYDLPKFETYSEKKEKEDETFRQKSRFEELNPDKSQYSRWKFRAAASNDDPIKVSIYGTRGERANQNIDINSKGSIMHFLDQSPLTGYVHENTRNYYEQLKDDDYLGYLKSNGDNTYSVQYKPRKEFTKDNLYKNTFLVRQVKFDDIDFNTKVKDDNFAGHTYPTIKGTTQAALPISSDPDENVYDYSSGQSVVFIFKYKGKIRYQHFAGSRNEIKKEGQDIKKMYNLGDKALRIGVADAGSYSSSISGIITNDKLNSKDYGYYNRNEGTGAGMAILP